MKKLNLRYIVTFLLLLPLCLSANKWNTPDMGCFTGQGKIFKVTNHTETKAMAAVSYNNQIWYFTNIVTGSKSKVSLRKLSNKGDADLGNWTSDDATDIPQLNDLGAFEWQPAAVVFKNVLYLFVGNKDGYISYSSYNAANESWSELTNSIGVSTDKTILGFGMAAVVVDDKLCVVSQDQQGHINIHTTSDLTNWTAYYDWNRIGYISSGPWADENYGAISAVSRTMKINGKKKYVLMFAYINEYRHPRSVVCTIDSNGVKDFIDDQVISTETTYQSVALAEGTVTGDNQSEGLCIQAFLKLDKKDNGYCRYRIQRYQLKEGDSWSKRENNLVKQNYLWARKFTNLCAINFGIADPSNYKINQYMCLFYTTYHDGPYYLTCAWAKTDYLESNSIDNMQQQLAGMQNTQYIGYIEGVPPYHLNNYSDDPNVDNYINGELKPISELEFETSQSQSSGSEMGFGVTGKVGVSAGCIKAGLSGAFGKNHGSDYTITTTSNIIDKATEENPLGFKYIILQPTISRAFYRIYDVNNTLIDSTYYYFMTNANIHMLQDTINTGQGLNPSDPESYHDRGINWSSYGNDVISQGAQWSDGGTVAPTFALNEENTNTTNVSLDLSAELGEMFSIGFDGSLDYTITTKTTTDNSITVNTRLKSAHDSTDITDIYYITYWIIDTTRNWWLPEGVKDNAWCITYEVNYIKYLDGTIIGSENMPEAEEIVSEETESTVEQESEEQLEPSQFSLAQNYPNPFKPYTVIKYQIGIEDLQAATENQGYQTRLAVYNLSGHQVALIVDEYKTAGSYEVNFDASQLTPGVYFYSLQSGNFRDIKKLILLE